MRLLAIPSSRPVPAARLDGLGNPTRIIPPTSFLTKSCGPHFHWLAHLAGNVGSPDSSAPLTEEVLHRPQKWHPELSMRRTTSVSLRDRIHVGPASPTIPPTICAVGSPGIAVRPCPRAGILGCVVQATPSARAWRSLGTVAWDPHANVTCDEVARVIVAA